jgi:hypothetical protein
MKDFVLTTSLGSKFAHPPLKYTLANTEIYYEIYPKYTEIYLYKISPDPKYTRNIPNEKAKYTMKYTRNIPKYTLYKPCHRCDLMKYTRNIPEIIPCEVRNIL